MICSLTHFELKLQVDHLHIEKTIEISKNNPNILKNLEKYKNLITHEI